MISFPAISYLLRASLIDSFQSMLRLLTILPSQIDHDLSLVALTSINQGDVLFPGSSGWLECCVFRARRWGGISWMSTILASLLCAVLCCSSTTCTSSLFTLVRCALVRILVVYPSSKRFPTAYLCEVLVERIRGRYAIDFQLILDLQSPENIHSQVLLGLPGPILLLRIVFPHDVIQQLASLDNVSYITA